MNVVANRPITANIIINIQPAFIVREHLQDVTDVEYGKESVLHCNIKSHLPMKINWMFVVGKPEKIIPIENTGAYNVLYDGTELKIKRVDEKLNGKYVCVAQLEGDKSVKVSYKTTVRITDLAKPELEKNTYSVKRNEKTDIDLHCKLLRGNPKPEITWQFNGVDINKRGEVLSLKNVGFHNSGKYTCLAKNIEGNDRHDMQLTVEAIKKVPQVTISEGASTSVPYNSILPLTCRVTSYPAPQITWTDSKGKLILSKTSPVKLPYEYVSYVQLSTLIKSEEYRCVAVNSLVNRPATANIIVNVQTAFNVHEHVRDVTNIEYGKEGSLYCNITSHLPMRISWMRLVGEPEKIKQIKSTSQYHISPDGTALKIKLVDKSLAGKYVCVAELNGDNGVNVKYQTQVNVVGLVKPEIEKMNKVEKAFQKTEVNLHCKVLRGNPKPEVTWQFKSEKGNTLLKSGEFLKLENVNFSSSGLYECIAKNIEGSDQHTIEFIVEGPPQIVMNQTDYEAVVDDIALRLPCTAQGSPKASISWQVNDTVVFNSKKYTIDGGTLTIHNPLERDIGSYMCIAENKFGYDKKTVDVSVTPGLNSFGEDIKKIYILTGSSAQVKCPSEYKDTDSLRWFKNEYPMKITASYIHIGNATFEHDGNYTCRISNYLGSVSSTVELDVGYPPRFKNPKYDKSVKWPGDVFSLTCAVESKPKENYTWYHNGVEIKDMEDQYGDELEIFDWGEYTCKATNVHGSTKRSFEVNSEDCIIDRHWKSGVNIPLLLDQEYYWPIIEPNQHFLPLQSTEKFVLSCHSNSKKLNFFSKIPNENVIEAICDKEDKFIVEGKTFKLSDLSCKENVMPDYARTGVKCLNDNTEIISVGFNVEDDKFADAYEVCYDTKNGVTLYAKTKLYNTNDYYDGPEKSNWYTVDEFGEDKSEKYKCKEDYECCYAKSQLINPIDLFYGPSQTATFVDHLNSMPILSSNCNETENWENVEKCIRSYLASTQGLVVWSGVSHFMNIDGLSVPRYLWKVVKENEDDSETIIAVVYVNHKKPNDEDKLCTDMCHDLEWMEASYTSIYCCHFDDFVKAFKLPREIFTV